MDIVHRTFLLFSGHAGARLVSFVGLFAMAAFYAPEAVGVFGIWMAGSTLVSLVISGRLEFPMVAADDHVANALFPLSIAASLAVPFVVGLAFLPVYPAEYVTIFAAAAAARACDRILMNWSIRIDAFRLMAFCVLIQAVVRVGAIVAAAFIGRNTGWSLILADLIAIMVSLGIYVWKLPLPPMSAILNYRSALTRRNCKTAFFNGLSAIAEVGALQLPTAIVGMQLGLATAGYFHMANRVCDATRGLTTAALSSTAFKLFSAAASVSREALKSNIGECSASVLAQLWFCLQR